MTQKPLIPTSVMEKWMKDEPERFLPPDHPIYSEPPSITFLNRTSKPSEKKQPTTTKQDDKSSSISDIKSADHED
jgi:hypothetical protein